MMAATCEVSCEPKSSQEQQTHSTQPAHYGDSGRNLSDCHGRHEQQRRHHGAFQRTPAATPA